MTILMFNTLYYPDRFGGAEKSVQLLAEELVGLGHKVVIVCLAEKASEVFNYKGVKVYKLKHKNIYWAFKSKRQRFGLIQKFIWHFINTYLSLNFNKIRQIIREEKPDLVHVNNISGFSTRLLKTIKSKNIPIVQTLRDYHYLCLKNTLYKNNKKCYSLCKACEITARFKLKHLNENANEIIGISHNILHIFEKNGLRKALNPMEL
jgi:glycosyltransferase involved in cell wall biosynthesis